MNIDYLLREPTRANQWQKGSMRKQNKKVGKGERGRPRKKFQTSHKQKRWWSTFSSTGLSFCFKQQMRTSMRQNKRKKRWEGSILLQQVLAFSFLQNVPSFRVSQRQTWSIHETKREEKQILSWRGRGWEGGKRVKEQHIYPPFAAQEWRLVRPYEFASQHVEWRSLGRREQFRLLFHRFEQRFL